MVLGIMDTEARVGYRVFEEAREEARLEKLKEIRGILLEELTKSGTERPGKFAPLTFRLCKKYPRLMEWNLALMQKQYFHFLDCVETAVKLEGEWQGQSLEAEIFAGASKSRIKKGEIDFPVEVKINMGGVRLCCQLDSDLSDIELMWGKEDDSIHAYQYEESGGKAGLKLGQFTDLIRKGKLQVVEG